MSYRNRSSSRSLTPGATWSLMAIAISACWAAKVTSRPRTVEAGSGSRAPLRRPPERIKVVGGGLGKFEQLAQQVLGPGKLHA